MYILTVNSMVSHGRGAKPRFSSCHVLLAVLLLSKRNLGRYVLSDYLNLSLASTRTLLEKLIKHGLAITHGQNSGRRGTSLSPMGFELAKEITNEMILLEGDMLASLFTDPGSFSSFHHANFLLKQKASFISNGIKERDLAIRAGAEGAVTLIKYNNQWVFPGTQEPLVPQPPQSLGDNHDVLIHVFASSLGGAFIGGVNASFPTLSKELQQDLSNVIQ